MRRACIGRSASITEGPAILVPRLHESRGELNGIALGIPGEICPGIARRPDGDRFFQCISRTISCGPDQGYHITAGLVKPHTWRGTAGGGWVAQRTANRGERIGHNLPVRIVAASLSRRVPVVPVSRSIVQANRFIGIYRERCGKAQCAVGRNPHQQRV